MRIDPVLEDDHYEPTYADGCGYWNAYEKDVPIWAEAVEPVAYAADSIEGKLQDICGDDCVDQHRQPQKHARR